MAFKVSSSNPPQSNPSRRGPKITATVSVARKNMFSFYENIQKCHFDLSFHQGYEGTMDVITRTPHMCLRIILI